MDLQQQKELTRKNLERVLTELPLLAEKYPEISQDFDMWYYGVYINLEKENLSKCGTAGCILGNSARIFEDEFTEDLFRNNKFDYNLFGKKYFPYLYDIYGNENIRWEYLFDSGWSYTEFNKFDDAIYRIKNLLDNDLECEEFIFEKNKIIN